MQIIRHQCWRRPGAATGVRNANPSVWKKNQASSTMAIKHQIRKLMLEDLVKETEVIARAEAIRGSLSEKTVHERETKAVSAPGTDHQSLISPPPAGAPGPLASHVISFHRSETMDSRRQPPSPSNQGVTLTHLMERDESLPTFVPKHQPHTPETLDQREPADDAELGNRAGRVAVGSTVSGCTDDGCDERQYWR